MLSVTREKLAGHLHSAIDRESNAVVALRIGHPSGLTWRIADGVLKVWGGSAFLGSFSLAVPLSRLRDSLVAAGVLVKYQNAEMMSLGADVLLDGAGDEKASNGDHLYGFTSTLWAFLDAYGLELGDAERQIVEAVAQLYIGSAEGELLDLWGEYFGVMRESGEADGDYRVRIIVETLRPKSNKYALENAASAVAGSRVEIFEPWTDLFWLSESKLDGERMFDGYKWSPHVFRPIFRGYHNIRWDRVVAVLEKIRPAGVLMLDPEWIPDCRGLDAGDVIGIGVALADGHSVQTRYNDKMNLDDYHLGDPVISNYRFVKFDLYTKAALGGIYASPGSIHSRRSFVRAQVVLSDMDEPLGHERCRFAGALYFTPNTPRLDEFPLSDFDTGSHYEAIEDVLSPLFSVGAESRSIGSGSLRNDLISGQKRLFDTFNLSSYLYLSDSRPLSGGLVAQTNILPLGVAGSDKNGLLVIDDQVNVAQSAMFNGLSFERTYPIGLKKDVEGQIPVTTSEVVTAGLQVDGSYGLVASGDISGGVEIAGSSAYCVERLCLLGVDWPHWSGNECVTEFALGLEVSPTFRHQGIGWSGNWGALPWATSTTTSGIFINVTTEIQ